MLSRVSLLLAGLVLAGCSSTQVTPTKVSSFYDYNFQTPNGQPISLVDLPIEILNADVVLVGEWHKHSGVHRFQSDLLKSLKIKNDQIALSMEQFTRDKQGIIDAYLQGEIGEHTLIKQGNAWPNYESDYRGLVEFAKTNSMPIIAANAPKKYVRCIGRQGLEYLDTLSSDSRSHLASDINISETPYKKKFMASMHHGSSDQTEKQYAAQVTWDETMAESIVKFKAKNPEYQVMHVAGKFHVEQGLGIASSIKQRAPELKVVVISPADKNPKNTDYFLEVLSPPEMFVKTENMMKAYSHLGKRNDDLTCL